MSLTAEQKKLIQQNAPRLNAVSPSRSDGLTAQQRELIKQSAPANAQVKASDRKKAAAQTDAGARESSAHSFAPEASTKPTSGVRTIADAQNGRIWDAPATSVRELRQRARQTENPLARLAGETREAALQSSAAGLAGLGGTAANALNAFLHSASANNPGKAAFDARADKVNAALGLTDKAEKLNSVYENLSGKSARHMEAAKAGQDAVGRTAADVMFSGTQMLADAPANLIAPGGSLAVMAARSFGDASQRSRQEGANAWQQVAYGAGSAAVEALSEKMFDGLAGIYGKGGADDIVKNAINRLTKNEAARRAWNIAASAAGESVEEFVSGIAAPALSTIYNGKSLGQNYSELEAGDVLYDMLIGGILGGLGGGVETATGPKGLKGPADFTPQTDAARRNAGAVASEAPGAGQSVAGANRGAEARILPQTQSVAPEGSARNDTIPMGDSAVVLDEFQRRIRHSDMLDELRDHLEDMQGKAPVVQLTGREFQKSASDGRNLGQKVLAFFNGIGNIVRHKDIGEIELNDAGVHDSIGHGMGKLKAAAFAALPDVLSTGDIIRTRGPYEGHNYDSIYIAAPVKIGGETCYVGALVIKDKKMQRYKLHEVLVTNGDGTPLFQTESTGTPRNTDGPLRNDVPPGSPDGSLSSNATIPRTSNAVKSDTEPRKLAAPGMAQGAAAAYEIGDALEPRRLAAPGLDTAAGANRGAEARILPQTQSVAPGMETARLPRMSMADFANTESHVWNNVDYGDTDTQQRLMQTKHQEMIAAGKVVKVPERALNEVAQAYPDLRGMKKSERTPVLKQKISELKATLRDLLNSLKGAYEFEVNGNILEARLYDTGVREVMQSITQPKAAMLTQSGDIFRNAQYLYSTPDYEGNPNIYRWNYFYSPVQIGDQTVGVRIAVRDMLRQTDGTMDSQIYHWGIKENTPLGGGERGSVPDRSDASSGVFPVDALGGGQLGQMTASLNASSAATIDDATIPHPSDAVKSDTEPRRLAAPGVETESTQTALAEARPLAAPGAETESTQTALAEVRPLAAPDLDTARETEPRYLPTAEDIENGYVPQSSAEYRDIMRRAGQDEAKSKRENRPSRSKGHLRHELLSAFSVPAGSKATFTERINAVADEMLRNGRITEENRAEMIRALYDAGVVTQEAEPEYQTARNALKGRRIYVNESVRAELGDEWNSLRTRAMGNGIYFVTDPSKGMGVDVVAEKMSDLIGPGIIDSEADGATQLQQMVDAAELGKGGTISLAEEADMLARQYGESVREDQISNLERQFDEAMRRFADKARLEVDLKDRADERVEREKQVWREAFHKKDEAKKQREAAALTLRNLKRLRRRIGQNDTRLAAAMERLTPEEQKIAREALGNISTDAQRLTERAKAKMEENAERYAQLLEDDPNYIPDKKTLALLERMDQTYLADMTPEELMSVHRALQMLEQHLTDMNKEIGKERGEEFSALYKVTRGEIESSKGRKKDAGKLNRFLNEEQLTPMNYLEMLGGWKSGNSWNQAVAKQLEEGERAQKQFVVEANDMLKDFREKNADWIAKSDGQGKNAIWYDIEVPRLLEYGEGHQPIFGKTVTVHLTPAMRVELARSIRNSDNLRHAEGGVTFPDKELYSKGQRKEAYQRGTTVKLAPETMKKLFAYENLTAEEKALYDVMDTFFDGKAKQAINETSQILDGVDRALTNHYSKIYTNSNYRSTDATKVDASIGGMPSLQKRVFSTNPVLAMSVWEAFDDTVDTVGKYHGLAVPVRNVNTLFNWTENGKSMKDAIAQKWGGDSVKYIEELLADLQNRQYTEKSGIDALAGKALNNYVTATFGMNPGIVLKQFSSFPSAAAVLGVDTIPTPAQIKNTDANLIAKYTPELEYRSMGYATPELAELKNNPNWTQSNKVTRFLFGGAIQGMDRFTVKAMWPWAENYVKKHNPELKVGSDAFYKKTAEVYNDAVSQTQPMYDVMHRAKIMQNPSDLTRAFTMFKTVPMQQQNMIRKAVGEAQNATGAKKAEANRALARTVTSIVAANLLFEGIEFMNQAWKNAAKKYRDDDDELTVESVGKGIAENALKDMVGMFIGGDEFTDALDIVSGKKSSYFAGLETPGLSQIQDIITSLETAGKGMRQVATDTADILQNGGSLADYVRANGRDFLGDVKDLAESMSVYLAGVPVTNIEKYLLGTLRAVSPKVEQEYKALFDSTTKRDLSGLEGEALQVRVDDLIDNRIEGVSDEAKRELARLYEATGSEVIPTDVPTFFTVDGERVEMTAAQEQRYRNAYTEALGGELDKLLTSEAYRGLDDEAKARAVNGLYNYAKASARSEVAGTEPDSSVEKVRTAKSMGLDPAQYFSLKASMDALDDLEGDEKTEAKIDEIRQAGLTPAGESAAYYAFVAKPKEKELIDGAAGLSVGEMTDTLMSLREDSMLEGADKTKAECRTLLGANLPDGDRREIYRTMLTDSHEDDIDRAINSGLSFDDYLNFQIDTAGLSSSKDANGKDIKGQTKRDKVLVVIDDYPINTEQKNALYYAAGYAESTLEKAPWYTGKRTVTVSRETPAHYAVPDAQTARSALERISRYEEPLYLAAP